MLLSASRDGAKLKLPWFHNILSSPAVLHQDMRQKLGFALVTLSLIITRDTREESISSLCLDTEITGN